MHGERSCNGDTTHTAALEGSGSHQTKMPNKATYALVRWLPPQRALEPRVPRGDHVRIRALPPAEDTFVHSRRSSR